MMFEAISKPTIIIDKEKTLSNIDRMAAKAKRNHLRFRPHFKTHQSAEVGNWFKDFNVTSITVSSLSMANYFADNGWQDITIAFPLNIREIKGYNELNNSIKLGIVLESIEALWIAERNFDRKVDVYLKVDCGYNRTGINAQNVEYIRKVVKKMGSCKKLALKGLLSHFGNTYHVTGKQKVQEIYYHSVKQLHSLNNAINDLVSCSISIGDTPSCSIIDEFVGIDEIRPGNFVFYDWMQYLIGSCKFEDIAMIAICPVVSTHQERNIIVIYGGAVHLSKDHITYNNTKSFGQIVDLQDGCWANMIDGSFVESLSQEHGLVYIPRNIIDSFSIGDNIGIVPIHSCLTANLASSYRLIDGQEINTLNSFL